MPNSFGCQINFVLGFPPMMHRLVCIYVYISWHSFLIHGHYGREMNSWSTYYNYWRAPNVFTSTKQFIFGMCEVVMRTNSSLPSHRKEPSKRSIHLCRRFRLFYASFKVSDIFHTVSHLPKRRLVTRWLVGLLERQATRLIVYKRSDICIRSFIALDPLI